MKTKLEELRKNSYMIVNNISMLFIRKQDILFLRTIDLNNLNYVAEFVYNKPINGFSLVYSTFSEGKRKYEMLYHVERNKASLLEGYHHA